MEGGGRYLTFCLIALTPGCVHYQFEVIHHTFKYIVSDLHCIQVSMCNLLIKHRWFFRKYFQSLHENTQKRQQLKIQFNLILIVFEIWILLSPWKFANLLENFQYSTMIKRLGSVREKGSISIKYNSNFFIFVVGNICLLSTDLWVFPDCASSSNGRNWHNKHSRKTRGVCCKAPTFYLQFRRSFWKRWRCWHRNEEDWWTVCNCIKVEIEILE